MKSVIGETTDAAYQLDEEIGRGAQGRVFSIKGGRYAFKLLGKKNSKDAQLLQRKISYIKTRDISDLNISKPIEQIKGEFLGYIMEIATDMMPLERLLKPTNDLNWWEITGGLKKRLMVLKKLSKLLADLHSRGLIYGDLSPKNVFISIDKDFAEVYLIDVDNITHLSKIGDAFYTPGYAAPEIVKGISGADTYTDDYSFSILAYQLLTLNHPFVGDHINNADPELEEEAYQGKVPWIEHSTDNINKSTKGLESSITISGKMMKEFINTFEINILNKLKRTSTLKWTEILETSLTGILVCASCRNTFFYRPDLSCPFCNEQKASIGIVQILELNATLKNELKEKYTEITFDTIKDVGNVINWKIASLNEYIPVTENDVFINKSEAILFEIKIGDKYNYIRGVNQKTIAVIAEDKIKEGVDIEKETKVSQGDWYLLSRNNKEVYQRVIKVKRYNR